MGREDGKPAVIQQSEDFTSVLKKYTKDCSMRKTVVGGGEKRENLLLANFAIYPVTRSQ